MIFEFCDLIFYSFTFVDFSFFDLFSFTILQHAAVSVGNNRFYGAEATVNVWKPHVQTRTEFSASQIWITGGSDSNLNSIEAGWIVNILYNL